MCVYVCLSVCLCERQRGVRERENVVCERVSVCVEGGGGGVWWVCACERVYV